MEKEVVRKRIRDEIQGFIQAYCQKNQLEHLHQSPLVGFADAQSSKITCLKEVIGPWHWMPEEILPGATVVLSYFLPFKKEIGLSNKDGSEVSPLWAKAYLQTNAMAVHLNEHLKSVVESMGCQSAIPLGAGVFDPQVLMSAWSQRHFAFAAGLGTFGINNMLITQVGCCGRYFSIVTDLKMEADQPLKEERCLYKARGTCSLCVKKCPSEALSARGFDRHKCYELCLKNEAHYPGAQVCGKCVAAVPCSFGCP